MRPSTYILLSVLINVVLLAVIGIIACSAAELPETGPQEPYSKADFRMYEASVAAGLTMDYEEYLIRKYPREHTDPRSQRANQQYWLTVNPVTERAAAWMENKTGQPITCIHLTGTDLSRYPLIGELLIADVPFPEIPAFRYEITELTPLTGEQVLIVWNDSLYSLKAVYPNPYWW